MIQENAIKSFKYMSLGSMKQSLFYGRKKIIVYLFIKNCVSFQYLDIQNESLPVKSKFLHAA